MIALYSFFSFKARKIATTQKIMAQPVTASDGSSLDENMKTMNGSTGVPGKNRHPRGQTDLLTIPNMLIETLFDSSVE